MSKEIVVSIGPGETRAVVIEDSRLVEVYIERTTHQRHVGNIYKGKVENVLPGMQAAFVNIGLERNAFLYVDDALKAREGHFDDVDIEDLKALSIRDILKENQDIIVQVTKEPIGTKGARVVTQVTLPGRNVVLMPTVDYIGVSRRITDDTERARLKKAASKTKPRGYGIIIRTAAEGKDEEEISSEIKFLTRLWRRVKRKERRSPSPSLLHRDYDLIYRIMRDLLTDDVDAFIVDDEHEFAKAEDIINIMSPRLQGKLRLYNDKTPILESYEIEDEIDKALRPKVWLSCGGYIVFDETEALTSIDVNTGRYIGTVDLQDTVLKTNLEAASAIAHHLRLRNIGGIIVVDFIDMDSEDAREKVTKRLENELKKDKTKATVLGFTHLGLLEMTRKKTRPGLKEVLTQSCPYCEGRGSILSEETLAFRAQRSLRRIADRTDQEAMLITLHPNVASLLIGQGGGNLSKLDQEMGKTIYVKGNPNIHIEDIGEIVTGKHEVIKRMAIPVSIGDVIGVEIEEQHASNPANGITRIDGYILDIDGAGGLVGKMVQVKIKKVFRTYAKGKPIQTKEEKNSTISKEHKNTENKVMTSGG